MSGCIRPLSLLLCLASLGSLAASAFAEDKDQSMTQDITIRGKRAIGPGLGTPPPVPEKLIFEDVLQSLEIHKKDMGDGKYSQTAKRLSRRFPEAPFLLFSPESFNHPYDKWTFEVLRGDQVIKHLQGKGRLHTRIGWDGTDPQGQMIARVDQGYRMKFTGTRDNGEEHTVATNLIMLGSMAYRHSYDYIYLDLANNLIFNEGSSDFSELGPDYLHDMAARMRQHNPKKSPYHLKLYQKDPNSNLAKARAGALKTYFSNELVIHSKKLGLEIEPIADRGDVLTCALPSREREYTQEEQE